MWLFLNSTRQNPVEWLVTTSQNERKTDGTSNGLSPGVTEIIVDTTEINYRNQETGPPIGQLEFSTHSWKRSSPSSCEEVGGQYYVSRLHQRQVPKLEPTNCWQLSNAEATPWKRVFLLNSTDKTLEATHDNTLHSFGRSGCMVGNQSDQLGE